MNTPIDRADAVIPGACFGYTTLPGDLAFVAARGEGSHLVSTAGQDYLDYTLGSGPLLLGHAHPTVTAAIADQASRGTHFYAMNETAVELAEFILGAFPAAEALKFCADGTQATFFALRLARAATGREKVLKFTGAYHGHHDYALPGFPGHAGLAGTVAYDYQGIPSSVAESVILGTFNDLEATRDIVADHAGELAAIIVEPVQRALQPAPGFLAGLRALADEIGALLIFDEVVTGFRLARGGAQELYGVTADLTALGKAIGGGLPMGAVAGARAIVEQLVPSSPGDLQRVFMSGTLNGNPLSAAAGLALVGELDRIDGRSKIAAHGATLRAGIDERAAHHGIPAFTNGPDEFFEVLFGSGPVTDLASHAATHKAAALDFGTELLRNGIYVVPGGKLYISAVHGDEDADRFLTAADAALVAVARTHGLS